MTKMKRKEIEDKIRELQAELDNDNYESHIHDIEEIEDKYVGKCYADASGKTVYRIISALNDSAPYRVHAIRLSIDEAELLPDRAYTSIYRVFPDYAKSFERFNPISVEDIFLSNFNSNEYHEISEDEFLFVFDVLQDRLRLEIQQNFTIASCNVAKTRG